MSNVDVIGLFKQAAPEVHGRELGTLDAGTEISTLGLDHCDDIRCLKKSCRSASPTRSSLR